VTLEYTVKPWIAGSGTANEVVAASGLPSMLRASKPEPSAYCGALFALLIPDDHSQLRAFDASRGDTSDTFFAVNGGHSRSWEATDPKLRKCLKPA